MSVSFEDLVWTLVFPFSVRRGCWLLREWSVARSCARGAARRVPVSERRRRRRSVLYSLDVPPVGRRPCRTRPGTGRTVRGVALLSCAVRVRSVVWRDAAGVVFARVYGPGSVAGAWALGSPRARGDWDPVFCRDCGHEYGD